MKNLTTKMMILALLMTIGVSTSASAQEVEGKIIQDYAKMLGETFEKQEKVNADLSSQRQNLMEGVEEYSEAIDDSKSDIERLENQTELTGRMVDLNRIDSEQVRSTMDTLVRAHLLTQDAGAYLRSGTKQSEALKEQFARNDKLLREVIPVINSLEFTADPERKEELKKSLILLAEYQEIAQLNHANTPAQIERMMRKFEDTISKLKIVQELLNMERQALVIATHAQLVAAAQKRLEAFVGGGELDDVAIGMAETIGERKTIIREKIIPKMGTSSPGSKLQLSTKWSDLERKYTN